MKDETLTVLDLFIYSPRTQLETLFGIMELETIIWYNGNSRILRHKYTDLDLERCHFEQNC